MTAKIRDYVADGYPYPISGDRTTIAGGFGAVDNTTTGTLWERVAESSAPYDTDRHGNRPSAYSVLNNRGPRVKREYTYPGFRQIVDLDASGIIRAGVRVK